MSLKPLRVCSGKSLLTSLSVVVIAAAAFSWLTTGSLEAPRVAEAQQSKSKAGAPSHDPSEHASENAALKLAFSGASVDLFFELAEVEGSKPGLAGLKFLDHVDVTGKELLRFEKAAGESWLIDPDTVFAFRMKKNK